MVDKLLTRKHMKFCPLCLKDNFQQKTFWSIITVTICLTHYVRLVTICDRCHTKINITSFWKEFCYNCEKKYVDMQTFPVSPWSTELVSHHSMFKTLYESPEPNELDYAIGAINSLISKKELQELLNLRPYQVQSLERAKIIMPRKVEKNFKWYNKEEIVIIKEKLKGELLNKEIRSISVKRATAIYRQKGFTFEKVVMWIVTEKLIIYRTNNVTNYQFADLLLEEDVLISLMESS